MPPEPLTTNTRALRARYPDYADVLTSIPVTGRFVFEPTGSAVLCRDATGGWVLGPDAAEPRKAAKEQAAQLVRGEATLYVVLGAGLGYDALELVEAFEVRSPHSVLLLVESRLELLRGVLAHVDWSPLLRGSSTVLLLGDPQFVVEEYLARHPGLAVLPIRLVVSPDIAGDPALGALGARLTARFTEARELLERQLGAVSARIDERRTRREPPHVLLSAPDLGYLAGAIVDGLEACGCGVDIQAERVRGPANVRAHDWVSAVVRFAPDIVLWMDRPEMSPLASTVLRALEIANVHWSVDSPRRMRIRPSELSMIDVHVCFDGHYLPDYPARTVSQLSLGVGLRPLPGCGPADASWPDRLGPAVSFVGSLGVARIAELRAAIARVDPDLFTLLDELAEGDEDPAPRFREETGKRYEGSPCFYVDEVRGARRRTEVLARIPASALRIYGGPDWAEVPGPLAACYAGRGVAYGFDLASLYYHSHVNLNVFHAQCVNSTNSRVYDVMAAGGFLLTEYRPRIEEEFEVGRHLVTFSTPDEAAEKVDYYLAHPAEREEIAREGQRHVLAHHTFVRRCRRILELAAPYAGGTA